jgi:hypothetical protein
VGPAHAVETAVPDVRELAAAETPAPARPGEGTGRLATAEETANAVERAQRALLELPARRAVEKRRAAEETQRIELAQRTRGTARVAEAVAELAD